MGAILRRSNPQVLPPAIEIQGRPTSWERSAYLLKVGGVVQLRAGVIRKLGSRIRASRLLVGTSDPLHDDNLSNSLETASAMLRDFPALPGFYQALFLYLEPLSTIFPAFLAWFFPGPEWFHAQLIPTSTPLVVLDARTTMAIWQLCNCYMLLGLISSLVFRAVRDTLHNDPEAQERILGASMTALALADVTHIIASWVGLPEDLRYSFGSWNPMTHGNITIVVFLLGMRLAWFAGIGRQRYYYGKAALDKQKST